MTCLHNVRRSKHRAAAKSSVPPAGGEPDRSLHSKPRPGSNSGSMVPWTCRSLLREVVAWLVHRYMYYS